MDALNKTFTFSQAQYNGLLFTHNVLGKALAQASPEDETPLSLSVMEVLQIVGEELMGKLQQ